LSDLQDLHDTFVVTPHVHSLKHFAVFTSAKFPDQLVVIQFTTAKIYKEQKL